MPRLAEERKIANSPFELATALKDAHKGEVAFVIGNGRSVEYYDTDKMHECGVTIGCNLGFKIHKLDYLCWQDRKIADECAKFEGSKVTSYKFHNMAKKPEGWYVFNYGRFLPDGFSKINTGGLGMQLAFLMGCNPIFLVGFDGCLVNGSGNMFLDKKNKTDVKTIAGGVKTTLHLMSHIDAVDRMARKYEDWAKVFQVGDFGISTLPHVDFKYFYSRERKHGGRIVRHKRHQDTH